MRKVLPEYENGVCNEKNENGETMNEWVQSKLMMVNVSFPRHTILLSDRNMCLADTAVTVHTTPYHTG